MNDPRLAASIIAYLPRATVPLAGEPTPGNAHAPSQGAPVAGGTRLVPGLGSAGDEADRGAPAPCRREGAILRTPHCAECCSDDSCPSCWVAGVELTLEHVPLPSRA